MFDDVVSALISIQSREGLTDSQFAETLGYKNRVSWNRVKSRRFPINDKLLVRAARRWKEIEKFLSSNTTNNSKEVTQNSHQSHQNKILRALKRFRDRFYLAGR